MLTQAAPSHFTETAMPSPAELIELGFAPVEVAATRPDGSCTCRTFDCPTPGKHPIGRGWLKSALNRRARSTRVPYFVRFAPTTSYGLLPPPGSGLLVIDRDDPEVGLPMPDTFEVHRASADPRKGHFYFTLDSDVDEVEVPRTFSGGEVRVAGSGHVVGPGSRHVSGDIYEGTDTPIGIADRELIDALRALPQVRRTDRGQVEAVEGSRHAWLVGQARRLRGQGLDAEAIETRLEELDAEYCVPPLDNVGEFGRMAVWAETTIKVDTVPEVVRVHGRSRRSRRHGR